MDRYPRQRVSHRAKSTAVISLSSYRWPMDQFRHKKIVRLVNTLTHLVDADQGVGARVRPSTKPGGVVGTSRMAKRKGSEEEKEGPETLLWIARRARTLAYALSEPDKSRILKYVRKLEAEAAALTALESEPDAPRQTKKRRQAKKPVRSPKTTRPKKPRK